MHARRVSNPRISRPPSPEYHHERTSSTPLLRRAPSPGPHKLHSPFASFSQSRPRSQHRRLVMLLIGALALALISILAFAAMYKSDHGLLDIYHAATEGTRAVPAQGWTTPAAGATEQAQGESQPDGSLPDVENEVGEFADLGEERTERVGGLKQEEFEIGSQQAELASLPLCKRTMVFKMAGLHGFGSEFNLLVRAATLARKYDYTLLPIDSSKWNYGNISAFFNPPTLSCRPPKNTQRRTIMRFDEEDVDGDGDEGSDGVNLRWTQADHVLWVRRDLGGLDKAVIGLFTNEDEVGDLHRWDLAKLSLANQRKAAQSSPSPALPASETVPAAYEDVFKAQSATVQKLWKPSAEIEDLVREVEGKLELASADRRKENAGDLTVGLHVRLGDKYLEAAHIGPQAYAKGVPHHTSNGPGLHHDVVTSYLTAATEHVFSLLTTSLGFSSSEARPTEWVGKPTLIVMSDDSRAWQAFAEHKLGQRFRVVGTPVAELSAAELSVESLPQDKKMVKIVQKEERSEGEAPLDPLGKSGGFNETSFNRMSLSARVALTKAFVRDITLLARHTDGLVLTASSNVGRLLLLLAGEKKALEGRVRSLDTRWFPTAEFY